MGVVFVVLLGNYVYDEGREISWFLVCFVSLDKKRNFYGEIKNFIVVGVI